MKLTPHVSFGGNCEAAFLFYERSLGGRIDTMLTWGNSPASKEVPSEWQNKIYHATLSVGLFQLMAGDHPPDKYVRPQGFEIVIGLDDPAEAERVFQALSENGTVQVPLQQTFWAARFGVLTDQFGLCWSVNCE